MQDRDEPIPVVLRLVSASFLGVAVLAIANAINTAIIYSRVNHAANRAFSETADGLLNPSTFRFMMGIHIFVGVAAALVAAALAYSVRRLTPFIQGFARSAAIVGVLCFALMFWLNAGVYRYGRSTDEVQVAAQQTSAAVPVWSQAITDVCIAVNAALLIAAAACLISAPVRRYVNRGHVSGGQQGQRAAA